MPTTRSINSSGSGSEFSYSQSFSRQYSSPSKTERIPSDIRTMTYNTYTELPSSGNGSFSRFWTLSILYLCKLNIFSLQKIPNIQKNCSVVPLFLGATRSFCIRKTSVGMQRNATTSLWLLVEQKCHFKAAVLGSIYLLLTKTSESYLKWKKSRNLLNVRGIFYD